MMFMSAPVIPKALTPRACKPATMFLFTSPPYTIVTTCNISASVTLRPSTIWVSTPNRAAMAVADRPPPCTNRRGPFMTAKSFSRRASVSASSTTLPPTFTRVSVCFFVITLFLKILFFGNALQHALEHHLHRDHPVGCFGDNYGGLAVDDCVAHNHVAPDRQAVHKAGLIGQRHLDLIYGPRTILTQYLAVGIIAGPVLGINKIGARKGLLLIGLKMYPFHKLRRQFVAGRMGHGQVHIGQFHPFHKGIGHSLRQGPGMRRPGQDHLGSLYLLLLLNGKKVGKTLQGVTGGRFETDDRDAAVLNKLIEYGLAVIVLPLLKARKRTYANDVAILTHHRNRLTQVFRLIAVHNHAKFGLQLPAVLIHIQHNHIHPQIKSRTLRTQAGTETGIKEKKEQGFITTQGLIGVGIAFYGLGLFQSGLKAAQIGRI